MNLFEIQPESNLMKTFHQQFRKKTSIQDNRLNYKIFKFEKCIGKRCKSLNNNYTIQFQQINQIDNKELISSCHCLDCGGRINKKILISRKEQIDPIQINSKSKQFPASPQLSIQPQHVRPSNRDLSLVGSPAHYSISYYNFYKTTCESLMPEIQLIQSQNLMKNIRKTYHREKETNTKISTSTHSLFNKVQQKMMINKNNDHAKLEFVQEIETKTKNEIILKHISNCSQFRIKTETYKNNFAKNNQKISIINNIPNLTHLEYGNKTNFSINESKTPRLLLARSELYNLKQPLTQRLLCTYLKKQNTKSKLIKSNNKG